MRLLGCDEPTFPIVLARCFAQRRSTVHTAAMTPSPTFGRGQNFIPTRLLRLIQSCATVAQWSLAISKTGLTRVSCTNIPEITYVLALVKFSRSNQTHTAVVLTMAVQLKNNNYASKIWAAVSLSTMFRIFMVVLGIKFQCSHGPQSSFKKIHVAAGTNPQ